MSSFNGAGTFNISGVGLPYIVDTVIDQTVANQLNTDLATGLSTCITRDGQSTTTQSIPFAAGLTAGNINVNGSTLNQAVLECAAGNAGGSAFGALFNGLSGHCLHVQIQDTGADLVHFNYGGGVVGTITTNATNTAYNTSSDARLKENIADSADAGAIIDALKVRQWDWKSTGAHEDFGFVAQEEFEVAPFAVTQGVNGKHWGRDDSKLVPLLVKEIQSLRRRLEALEG